MKDEDSGRDAGGDAEKLLMGMTVGNATHWVQ